MSNLSFTRDKRDARVSHGLLLGTIETPALILRTYMGNLLFSPPVLADEAILGNSGPILGQIELADIVSKDYGDKSLHELQRNVQSPQGAQVTSAKAFEANKFLGAHTPQATKLSQGQLKVHSLTGPGVLHMISGRSLQNGVSQCSDTGISITTPGGRRTVSATAYAQRIALDRPQLVVSLADEFPLSCTSKNRITRCETRTSKMLQELIDVSKASSQTPFFLFGVALGGLQADSLALNVKAILAAGAQGVCVGSVNQNTGGTAGASSVVGETEEAFIAQVRAVRDATLQASASNTTPGTDVPLLVPSCDSLRSILHALDQGADVISSNLPSLLTSVGQAVAIDWAYINAQVEAKNSSANNESDADVSGQPSKRRRITAMLDLWDDTHTSDAAAMLGARGAENTLCPCHACKHHTRAYIHHLLQAKELLSEVLLYGHNQMQLLELFKQARRHSAGGTFGDWVKALRTTYDLTDIDFKKLQGQLAASTKGGVTGDD